MTSFDVIRRVKKITGQKKMGHIGTLDPLATGVLPLFLGKMTKLIPHFNLSDKVYEAEITFGFSSPTLDLEGELTAHPIPDSFSEELVLKALEGFKGDILQIPPMFSAIKKNGKKLYELARKGEEIEREPRPVTIYELDLLKFNILGDDNANQDHPKIKIRVHCSKGTYIRTLADDLGAKLGTKAILSGLERTQSGSQFFIEQAVTLDQIENNDQTTILKYFLDPASLLTTWLKLDLQEDAEIIRLSQGQKIRFKNSVVGEKRETNQCFIYQSKKILALGHLEFSQDDPIFVPEKVLI